MQDSSTFFKRHPKCGKKHLMVENCYYLMEMIEQCSRCSLPTGSGISDQKSENVKSCVTPMPTNNPIFVIIRFIKTPLHYEKLLTWVNPLRSLINFIVGPTGPNKSSVQNGVKLVIHQFGEAEIKKSYKLLKKFHQPKMV